MRRIPIPPHQVGSAPPDPTGQKVSRRTRGGSSCWRRGRVALHPRGGFPLPDAGRGRLSGMGRRGRILRGGRGLPPPQPSQGGEG